MKLIDPLPRAVVLGNYESWSDAEEWISEFNRLGVDIMENETSMFQTVKGDVCIRGLGDKFTNRYNYVDYPEECENIPKFTITHDPAGAFNAQIQRTCNCWSHSLRSDKPTILWPLMGSI